MINHACDDVEASADLQSQGDLSVARKQQLKHKELLSTSFQLEKMPINKFPNYRKNFFVSSFCNENEKCLCRTRQENESQGSSDWKIMLSNS